MAELRKKFRLFYVPKQERTWHVATTYGYLAGGHGANSTTPLVQSITQSGTTLTYTYDDAGNITSVSDGSKTISYEYDLLGQLTRVNDPYDTTASTSGTTWKYVYDQGGNIQSKTAYVFTTGTVGSAVKTDSFTYGDTNWKDKLTAFNGQTITYDAIGNPTNDGTWNYTWIGGRQMRAMYKGEFGEQGYDEITFEYNENGLRTKKTRMYYDDATGDIGYKATNYTLHGKNIVHMSDGSNNLHFFYDAQNKPAVVLFNGTAYAYLYNLQGDVIGLVDSNGSKMVSYTYDAWGKPISKTGTLASTLGTIQPFRYRGYVYDEETGLYYLCTRYYRPVIGRFYTPDNTCFLTHNVLNPISANLLCYCYNNPVTYSDETGTTPYYASPPLIYSLLASISAFFASINPVVWIVAAIAVTAVIATVFAASHIKAGSKAHMANLQLLASYSCAAPPPPPEDPKHKGTKTDGSVTKYTDKKNGIRLDVENMSSSAHNVHVHVGDKKYYYDVANRMFHDASHTPAPKAVQELLNNEKFVKKLIECLQMLGY